MGSVGGAEGKDMWSDIGHGGDEKKDLSDGWGRNKDPGALGKGRKRGLG